ncbi:MAG: DUF3365 domain-containing protein [Saprospirales bacterium]|nr:DUF3365 domain-containing protein [Saprospirales bacterium]
MIRFLIPMALFLAIAGGCQPEPTSLTEAEQTLLTRKGQDIVTEVATVLSSALTKSIADGGVGKAAQYCSFIAVPLVDTLAVRHGVDVRRTSNRLRNAKNAPTDREREVLTQYEQQRAQGAQLQPLLEVIDAHTVAYYQPIVVQPLCLQCHGKLGETLPEENYSFIKYLYPNDEAIGYALDDVRGIWSMRMPRQASQNH